MVNKASSTQVLPLATFLPLSNSATDNATESHGSLGHVIGRVLQAILPCTWFCWISRGTIQIQFILRPDKWPYWTCLLDDSIYLGAMPLKNWNHIDTITGLGIKAILAVNKKYEFQAQLGAEPVQSHEWESKEIKFLRISSPDLKPIKVEKLARAVDYVKEQFDLGNPIYIHCTGGRGRSVSVAIASLMEIKGYTLEDTIKHVKKCRPQMMLSHDQIAVIKLWAGNKQKFLE